MFWKFWLTLRLAALLVLRNTMVRDVMVAAITTVMVVTLSVGSVAWGQAPPKKLDPPSADEQKRLMGEIDEVYKPSKATDQTAKAALARKLLEDGRKNEANRAEQFVLLRRAGEIARDAGEADLMLEAVDAIVAAGFDIQPLTVKARLLKQLVAQTAAGGASQLSTASACCVKFAEEASAGGAVDEAIDLLEAANKLFAKPVMQAQRAVRAAKAALARTRTEADKAEREKKTGEAQAELDALKSAQSALAGCVQDLQQARREHETVQAAEEKLKTAPDDPKACLAVGRWYCFQKGDWEKGLPMLALGQDAALKAVAAQEIGGVSKADDEVKVGDAWWDLAEKAKGKAKTAMHGRAAHWYQEAMPDLAPGLGKARVEKRLANADENRPSVPNGPTAHIPEPPRSEGKTSKLRSKVIPETIDEELRLPRRGGPYQLVGRVTIGKQGALLIERGAMIMAAPGAAIMANGTLNSYGENDDFVVFRPATPLGWDAIILPEHSVHRIERFDVRGAATGLQMEGGAKNILDCVLMQNRVGVSVRTGGGPSFKNCIIANNLEDGIRLWGHHIDVDHCTIANNGGVGIYMTYYGTPVITSCEITGNRVGLKSKIYTTKPELHRSNIVGNQLAIEVVTTDDFACKGNFWGTNNPQLIANMILDGRRKGGGLGAVIFEPFEKTSLKDAGSSLRLDKTKGTKKRQ